MRSRLCVSGGILSENRKLFYELMGINILKDCEAG